MNSVYDFVASSGKQVLQACKRTCGGHETYERLYLEPVFGLSILGYYSKQRYSNTVFSTLILIAIPELCVSAAA